MRILITGASGNVGAGVTAMLRGRHELVLHDNRRFDTDLPLIQGDIQVGDGLVQAAQGCDAIIHTPAWHGIHVRNHTETDFWRLNVDGTFHMFRAAVAAGVKQVVFLSSTAWYGHYDQYGFTKRIGEELCEYYWQRHGIRYAALRPAAFVPFKNGAEGAANMVRRFVNGDPDRRDVLECVRLAVENQTVERGAFHVQCEQPFTEVELKAWNDDPLAVLEARRPGSAAFIERHGFELSKPLRVTDIASTKGAFGWQPKHNLLTFLDELQAIEDAGSLDDLRCDYPPPLV